MIIKIANDMKTKDLTNLDEILIINDIEWVNRKFDSDMNLYLEIKVKGNDEIINQPITISDKNNNHPAVVTGIWLMNNEGKTIDRLA